MIRSTGIDQTTAWLVLQRDGRKKAVAILEMKEKAEACQCMGQSEESAENLHTTFII
jgi:hypothetical protein